MQCLLGNTDLGVLKWLRERWAGHVYNQTRRSQPGWNRVFQWHVIPNERRLTFLEDIRPFLKVAAPATDNALAILRLKRDHFQTGQPYSDFVYASLRQGYERHMALALRPKRLKVGSVLDD